MKINRFTNGSGGTCNSSACSRTSGFVCVGVLGLGE